MVKNKIKIISIGFVAMAVTVATLFTFCAKQAEKTGTEDYHHVKTQKAGLWRSPVVSLGSTGYCVYLDIVCMKGYNPNGDTCWVDGNYYIVDCQDTTKEITHGTYHVAYDGNGWRWAKHCFIV